MSIRRIVPNTASDHPAQNKEFYTSFLGLDIAMKREEIIIFAEPGSPTTQISLIRPQTDIPHPDVSIEVDNVDAMFERAVNQGREVIYPITDEPWGVRRFFVEDPNGTVINILSHL
ncbi:VOC family protein [Fodinibius salsisoli]|uniref:VOC family protein n=1 Tax=Fodinibius salsisoli TaxID=2820877 RepID=A0ABT3PHU4_9BACT|nr:VOC family protein [Fodinibius salsisoli]MCW9705491.1 VOC family protein [Fodinibius salsisoli]